MTDTALHLVRHVVPKVPLRQWVCTLPWRLRVWCGFDAKLCARVVDAFVTEVMRSLKRRAKRRFALASVAEAKTGAVTFVQRFDSGLRLNVHAHTLALDGVYLRGADGRLQFVALSPPTAEQVADVAKRTAKRVAAICRGMGREVDGSGDDGEEPPAEQMALQHCYSAAARGQDLFGERAGRSTLRTRCPGTTRLGQPAAVVAGFNVHAKRALHGADHKQLEGLLRYLARPPIATQRLTALPDGRIQYQLKQPWSDGTVSLTLDPLDLIARLCALVPSPRFHLVRYHGVLSSHSKLRAQVIPRPPPERGLAAAEAQVLLHLLSPRPEHVTRNPWIWLLDYAFGIDLSHCRSCGERNRWVEVVTEGEALARLLRSHGLERAPPRVLPLLRQLCLPLVA